MAIDKAKLKIPSYFMEKLCKIKPVWYQEHCVNEFTKDIIIQSPRKMGKSEVCAMHMTPRLFYGEEKIGIIIAPTLNQAHNLLDKVKNHLTKNNMLLAEVEIRRNKITNKKNGNILFPLPGSAYEGRTVRTYEADWNYYDEASYISRVIYKTTTPFLSNRNGQIIMASTQYLRDGYYYENLTDPKTDTFIQKNIWKRQWGIDAGILSQEFLDKEKIRMTSDEFEQEYGDAYFEVENAYFSKESVDNLFGMNKMRIEDFNLAPIVEAVES